MSSEKTSAVIIRMADFSETSRVITCFTKDFGKISALAKGAKRLKGPFQAALDLLAECQIVFIRKSSSSLDLLTEAELTHRFRPPARDLFALYGGYYVAELLASLTEEHDPHPRLYDSAVSTLRRLESEGDKRATVIQFEITILQEIGQFPEFDRCVLCSRPVEYGSNFAFWVSQHGLLCSSCRREEFASKSIDAGTVAVLNRLAKRDSSTERLQLSDDQIRQLRHLLTPTITSILERRPKMLRYLQF